MKVLTIKEPYATLIAEGLKELVNLNIMEY